jgi:oligoendopeptidase F
VTLGRTLPEARNSKLVSETLPRWDLSDLFASVSSRAFVEAEEQLRADAVRLAALYDQHHIGACPPHPPTADEVRAFDEVVAATNDLQAQMATLSAFVHSFVTTDSYDDEAQAAASRLLGQSAALRALSARFATWVAALGPDALAAASPTAYDHRFPVERAAARARHQMSDEAEELYAALSTTGSSAWTRLHADITSQLSATVVRSDGGRDQLPMAAVRGLATDADPVRRRAAYEAELEAWPTVANPLAAAMNAIKGEAITVNDRRSWADPIDASLFANAVDRATFDAMCAAVDAAKDDLRRWLRTKARLHGHAGGLPWWDLFAPLPAATSQVSWEQGTSTVLSAFGEYSPALADLARRAIHGRWIDAEARDGKRGGAFCAPLTGERSIVFLNWSGSADSVQTLAHELGHAYHNVQLAQRTPLQRQLPMALAETASIFCETVVVEANLATGSDAEKLSLLDVDLQGTTQIVLDIWSRLTFEAEVFTRRRAGTIAARDLCDLMVEAQRDAYGDGLDDATLHPYMWAVKPHYYGSHFYNWPYTYGLLFGLGLFAEHRRDPERFAAGYDNMLSATGLADAADLGARFGIDVRDIAFWTASLDVVRDRIAAYEALAATAS